MINTFEEKNNLIMKKLEPDIKKGIPQISARTDTTGISFKNIIKQSQYSPEKFTKFKSGNISSQNNVTLHNRFSSESGISNPMISLSKDQRYSINSQKTNSKNQNNSILQNRDLTNKEIEMVNAKCSSLMNENQKLKEDNTLLKSELAAKTSAISGYTRKIRDLTEDITNLNANDSNLVSTNLRLKTLNEAEKGIIEELKDNINVLENELIMQKVAYAHKTIEIKKEINNIMNEFNTILSSKYTMMDEIFQKKEGDFHQIKNILINKLREFEKSSLLETPNEMHESSLMLASSLNSDYNMKNEETSYTNENMSNSTDENINNDSNKKDELFKQLKDIQMKIHNVEVFLQARNDLDDQKRKEMRNMIIFLNNEKNEIFQKLESKLKI